MGLFGSSNDVSIVEAVENATSEKNVEEDWGVIMNICDRAGRSCEDAKSYLRAIVKRLYNSDPHIGVKAVTLLDACVKNSGKDFLVEVASREFESDFNKLLSKAHPTVVKKLKESLRRWAENEFKSDVQLSLIPSLFNKLRHSGIDFSSSETPVKKSAPVSKDPNVVESQEEEEQILKAIELSLKETSGSPRNTTSSSLYPSVNIAASTAVSASSAPAKEPRKVRALYDFEAAEDNELTFNSGEIIVVIDDSDANWWKGSNQRGEGLFPANFVTSDLNVEVEKFWHEKSKKVQFKENLEVKVVEKEPEEVEINEEKIDRLLHLLHEADPTNPDSDTAELLNLEKEVNRMGPLIDSELERVDRKHAQLTQLSADLVEALGLYHTLMREPQFPTISKPTYGYPPSSGIPTYNGIPVMPNPSHPMPAMPPLPPGHERQYIPQGLPMPPQGNPQYFPAMPAIPSHGHMPPNMPPMSMPQGLPPHPNMMEERRQEMPPHMGHYPSMGTYGPPPGIIPSNFGAGGPTSSQTNMQNGQPQQPAQYVSSSHTMH